MKTKSARILKSALELLEVQSLRDASDQELVRRFVGSRDEVAFRVIVERHGPMVMGVCRRALGCAHDAEDAFQATFLVLTGSAQSLRNSESLGSWLHGIARRVSGKLVRQRVRRERRHKAVTPCSTTNPIDELTWAEVRTALDEELQRLPVSYRDVLVCCYLEGKTRDEAAKQLGLTPSALHGRLERARKLLAERLAARGLSLSSGLLVCVSQETVSALSRAVALVASQACEAVSPCVLSLANEVMKGMLMSKVKLCCATMFAAIVIVASVSFGIAQDKPAPAPKDEPRTKEADAQADAKRKSAAKTALSLPVVADKSDRDTDEEYIRRLSLDLRGIEPTPTEVHFFVNNKDAKKRETLVDLFIKERRASKAPSGVTEKELPHKPVPKAPEVPTTPKLPGLPGPTPVPLTRVVPAVPKAELELLKNKVEMAKLTVREKEILIAFAKDKSSASAKPEDRLEAAKNVQLLQIELERAKLSVREAELNLEVATKQGSTLDRVRESLPKK